MTVIKGAYNTAKIYAENIEETAYNQIQTLCNQEFVKNSKIRIMPDVHAGAGCVIGFTADLGEMVIPNIVGVDIGCGMLTVELGNINIDFSKLDRLIKACVPSGKNVHEYRIIKNLELENLNCYSSLKKIGRIEKSIGTLGGGNHFIEINKDNIDNKYLVIHTGSRNLGKQVAEHYQQMAYDICRGAEKLFEEQKKLITNLKACGKKNEIQNQIIKMKEDFRLKESNIPKELCYLKGEYLQMYLNDMKICQEFATKNRIEIANTILSGLLRKQLSDFQSFETIHNYIEHDCNIVRKGAVSAKKGEKLLIPINMRDGSLLCIGKGNEDWNCSAPHGAGRLYSRKDAKEAFTIEEFKKAMEGIYTTSICEFTLDESPMAYKNMDDIVNSILPTADIIKIIKPIYNFKAIE